VEYSQGSWICPLVKVAPGGVYTRITNVMAVATTTRPDAFGSRGKPGTLVNWRNQAIPPIENRATPAPRSLSENGDLSTVSAGVSAVFGWKPA
jgi:hypothetical protein